jgi:hypothetical protein
MQAGSHNRRSLIGTLCPELPNRAELTVVAWN